MTAGIKNIEENRSILGKLGPFRLTICWDCAMNWGNLYHFTRKVLALSAFILAATAVSPLFTHAQQDTTATLNLKISNLQRQLDQRDAQLAVVPEQLATIKIQISDIQNWQKETTDRMNWAIWGILSVVGVKMLDVFGIRLNRKKVADG